MLEFSPSILSPPVAVFRLVGSIIKTAQFQLTLFPALACLLITASAVSAQPKVIAQDAHYARAQEYMLVGKYLDALKELNLSIQSFDKAWWILVTRAKVLMGLNCGPEAIHDLEKVTKMVPSSRSAWLLCALLKSQMGNRAGSIEAFESAVALAPKGPIVLDNEKDIVRAMVASAERGAQKIPDARTFMRLAFSNLLAGKYAASAKASARACEDEKVLPHALVVSAYAKYFLNQREEAFADARKAAALRRHDLCYHFPIINLHLRAGTLQKAVREYDALLKKEPTNSTFYASRAEVYRLLNNNAKALEDLNTAIKCQALQAELYRRRAALYVAQHNAGAAISDLGKAIKLPPDNGEFYEERAEIFASLGDSAKAEADYSKAIALNYNLAKNYNARSICYRKLGRAAAASADMIEVRKTSHPFD